MDNYPPGMENDPSAPWNTPEMDFAKEVLPDHDIKEEDNEVEEVLADDDWEF